MRELIKPFLFLILLIPFATNAYASACGNNADGCAANEYCAKVGGAIQIYQCEPCPSSYPLSDAGGGEIEDIKVCYKTCDEEGGWPDRPDNVDNGKWVPKPNEDKAYYNTTCQYNLECNGYYKPCDGFHPDANNESCINNEQVCEVETGSGFKYWLFDASTSTGEYSECYITTCNEGYHLETASDQSFCGIQYGECVSNTAECASLLKKCDGTITGDAKWNDAGWDYDKCRCETDNGPIENGTGSSSCPWNSDEGNWSTDCERDVVTCHVGYCEHKDETGSCAAARPGWYHDNDTSAECQPCPAGMTSDGTNKDNIADSIEKCGMRTGPNGTRFCDSHGCFTLPGNGELIYYKAW